MSREDISKVVTFSKRSKRNGRILGTVSGLGRGNGRIRKGRGLKMVVVTERKSVYGHETYQPTVSGSEDKQRFIYLSDRQSNADRPARDQ